MLVAECFGPEEEKSRLQTAQESGRLLETSADGLDASITQEYELESKLTRAASVEVVSSASSFVSASSVLSSSRSEQAAAFVAAVTTAGSLIVSSDSVNASLLTVSSVDNKAKSASGSVSAPVSRRPSLGRGQAPCFVKNLPSRVELIEGSAFNCMAKVGRGGCAPWFVRPLPSTFEIEQGKSIESKCFIGDAFAEEITATKKEQEEKAPKLKKMEGTNPSTSLILNLTLGT